MSSRPLVLTCVPCAASTVAGAQEASRTWNFDGDTTGQIARGFTNEVGAWSVVEVGNGKVLAQTAKRR